MRQKENDIQPRESPHEENMFEHQNNEKIYKTHKKVHLIAFINNHYVDRSGD